jgi:long-chain acyl-CoA synthetase
MNDGQTLPSLLWRNAQRWPNRPAWRHKYLGIWQTRTWSAFAARTRGIALGLAARGLQHGDRLAVLGDNRPDLYAALIAAQALGGVGVPLDPVSEQDRLAAILADCRAGFAVADTADQATRLQSLADAAEQPIEVFCADASGIHGGDAWRQRSLDALLAAGKEADEAALPDGVPQDLALLLYPADPASGIRPLALSHRQLLAAAEAIDAADPVRPADEALCYLPMASYDDALYSLSLGLLGGFACNCPEAPDSIPRNLREIGPTILCAPPAACVALVNEISAKAEAVTGLKRRVFRFFQQQALRAQALREQSQAIPAGLGIGCRIGELLAYAPVRDQLGLSRARWVRTGAPLPPETARLLRAFGVALRFDQDLAPLPAPAPETQHA